MSNKPSSQLEITLLRSPFGHPEKLRRVLTALGLRHVRQCIIRVDHPSIRGMLTKVRHLVEVRPHAST
jgi:large subunit ribosomal protein L30